ncbi:glycosyl transferase [Crenothrix sp. D3]|nr:glycosyl transferase [Crenothrix sp. D3]
MFLLQKNVAVLVPCYNEEKTIRKVVKDFQTILPDAAIYVFDNNSSDQTKQVAKEAGAIVRTESHSGKGNVIRRMFADVEADIYILVDGDDTYDATTVLPMIEKLVANHLDMVVGVRQTSEETSYRKGHKLGNALLTGLVAVIFGHTFTDMLSGYRVMSRRFVKSFPALTKGFEIETELTVHALELRMPTAELLTFYRSRPQDSISKLNTYRDGFRILSTILRLYKDEHPQTFFSIIAFALALASVILAYPLFETFLKTGLVPRIPTAILSTGLMLLAFLSLASGLILETVTRGRQELKRLMYLSIPAIGNDSQA